jgi:hypothetical protein
MGAEGGEVNVNLLHAPTNQFQSTTTNNTTSLNRNFSLRLKIPRGAVDSDNPPVKTVTTTMHPRHNFLHLKNSLFAGRFGVVASHSQSSEPTGALTVAWTSRCTCATLSMIYTCIVSYSQALFVV